MHIRFGIVLKAGKSASNAHTSSHAKKREEFPVIANYNIDKTAPTKIAFQKRESLGSSLT